MNEIKIFENTEFGSVRTIAIDGEPYFVGKDVAVILGYSNPRDALAKHVDDEGGSKMRHPWWNPRFNGYQRVRSLQSYSFEQNAKCEKVQTLGNK